MTAMLAPLTSQLAQTTTDQVFEALYQGLITFQLEPGAKISEAEIAKQLGVSRQPVRDAFFRLSKLGFLSIRPQRATLITKISSSKVAQAAFVRCALEVACIHEAVEKITDADLQELNLILARQKEAIDNGQQSEFHDLDNYLHRRICEMAGHGYAWPLIQEQKAHIDRARFLSLSFEQSDAYDQHCNILQSLIKRDAEKAEADLRHHLGRIHEFLPQIRDANPQYFEDTEE